VSADGIARAAIALLMVEARVKASLRRERARLCEKHLRAVRRTYQAESCASAFLTTSESSRSRKHIDFR
jgi:hypothetical protein